MTRSGRAAGRRPWLIQWIQCHRTRPKWVFQRLKMGILEPTGWGSMDYIGLSNDIKWWYSSLGWISRACWEDDFRLVTHIDWQKEISLFPWRKAYPRKGIQPTNSINYHSKMAMVLWPATLALEIPPSEGAVGFQLDPTAGGLVSSYSLREPKSAHLRWEL